VSPTDINTTDSLHKVTPK